MSDTTRGSGDDAARPDQRLTVEDAGTTTDPADLVDDGSGDRSRADAATTDDDPGHVFDQTNGMADGLDGDSDGTAESDELSAAERDAEDPTISDAEVRSDDDGVRDLRGTDR